MKVDRNRAGTLKGGHSSPGSSGQLPPLILVVGMHRSGTSLLGSILQAIGVGTPGELIAGDPHNPEGYFERRDITDLQEQLLIDLGRWWPSAAGVLDLPPDWLIRPQTRQFCQQLAAILRQERDQQCRTWAIKDPRSSLLLPLWRRVCGELAIPLKLLLAVRDPAEVAASLCHRDAAAAGMTPERAEALWWRHQQAVLRHSRDLPLEVIDYGRWFGTPAEAEEQLQRLARFCGLNGEDGALQQAGLASIRPDLRRSRRLPLPEASTAQACYQLLRQSCTATSLDQAPSNPARISRRGRWLKRLKVQGRSAAQAREQLSTLLAPWFDAGFYRSRHPDLQDHPAPLLDYLKDGWLDARWPHPLFDATHYQQRCQERGFTPAADQSPLEHFLRCGALHQIPCTPLLQPGWFFGRGQRLQPERPPALADLHPWGAAALSLADGELAAAAALLQHWLTAGVPEDDLHCIARVETPWLRWSGDDAIRQVQPTSIGRLESIGLPASHWLLYGWRAALVDPVQPDGATAERIDAALLVPLPTGTWPTPADCQAILQATTPVLDPDPQRCRTWRRLGVGAMELPQPSSSQLEAWLAADPWLERAAAQLGLPHPDGLLGIRHLCLGSGGAAWDQAPPADTACLPGFDQLLLANDDDRRALTAWLWHCQRRGLQLLHLVPRRSLSRVWTWLALETLDPTALTPDALEWELRWRAEGRPDPEPIQTPAPPVDILWQHTDPSVQAADVAVVVSLHNYGACIEAALASVECQTLEALELVVVDDASSDDGAAVVERWLNRHRQRFVRALLLRHRHNGGLAAARNTGFSHATAPWCFVLDADNSLEPAAAEVCRAIARCGSARLAVVHPLIRQELEDQTANAPATGLISPHSWQVARWSQRPEGNYIDAMALVRRSAWQAVGGYSHIPGGWEDFDFWCCLIEAGFHGVQCPLVVARYRVHPGSMLHAHTHRNVRRLSRLLQHRHPWLHLLLAGSDC
ncbi:MAG: glycosyltransferase [Cyanobacteriota bacterium]|nr:glycosyltransferase [Cyanobacteriota bacterium]